MSLATQYGITVLGAVTPTRGTVAREQWEKPRFIVAARRWAVCRHDRISVVACSLLLGCLTTVADTIVPYSEGTTYATRSEEHCDPLHTQGGSLQVPDAYDAGSVCGTRYLLKVDGEVRLNASSLPVVPAPMSGVRHYGQDAFPWEYEVDSASDVHARGCDCSFDKQGNLATCRHPLGAILVHEAPLRPYSLEHVSDSEDVLVFGSEVRASRYQPSKVWTWRAGKVPEIKLAISTGDKSDVWERAGIGALAVALARIPQVVLASLPEGVTIVALPLQDWVTALAGDPNESYWADSKNATYQVQYAAGGAAVASDDALIALDYEDYWHFKAGQVEEVLIHEFGHLIDYHHDVTDRSGWWRQRYSDQSAQEAAGELRFVSTHAARNIREHFAESLKAWTALYAGNRRIAGWWTDAHPGCSMRDHIRHKARKEMGYWNARGRNALFGVTGAVLD